MRLIDNELLMDHFWKYMRTKNEDYMQTYDRMTDYAADDAYLYLLRHKLEHRVHEGIIYVWETGMDCDCVQFGGLRKITVPEGEDIVAVFEAWENEQYDGADGPLSHAIITYERAQEVQPYSRDLAAEAYENGHPHVVYP